MRTAATLEALAIRWLSQREHSRSELRGKLMRAVTSRSASAASETPPTEASAAANTTLAMRRPSSESAATRAASAAEIDGLLDRLIERGYLDDARFAESRIRARAPTAGHRRIVHELRRHGVSLPEGADRALLDSEFARACALWDRRFGRSAGGDGTAAAAAATDPREATRRARLLVARGFAPEVVRRVLKQARCGEPDDSFDPS